MRSSPSMVSAAALWCAAVAATAFIPASLAGQDAEEILSFDAQIDVGAGGVMLVTETIVVRVRRQAIRHGIFRDLPSGFQGGFLRLRRIEVPFRVHSVTRNGAREPFFLDRRRAEVDAGGVRIRIGDERVMLGEGVHTYEIRYETERWVSFGDREDQLYWNVTGNNWAFPIRAASARVRISGLESRPRLESWTGPTGSTTTAARSRWDEANQTAEYDVAVLLRPLEGFTIRLSFPSGELSPPTDEQLAEWSALEWGGYPYALSIIAVILGTHLLVWFLVGVDPRRGQVRLQPEPPAGHSPAGLGFIQNRGFDQMQLSAALVSMAVKGAVRLKRDAELECWILEKADHSVDLAPEERALFQSLFLSREALALHPLNEMPLSRALETFKKSLKARLAGVYFSNNRIPFAALTTASFVALVMIAWNWRFYFDPLVALFVVIPIGWVAAVVVGVVVSVKETRKRDYSHMPNFGCIHGLGMAVMALFGILGLVLLIPVVVSTPSHIVFSALALTAINVPFYKLLQRPTRKGRSVLDQLEGFQAYLGDSDRHLKGSERDMPRFERHLPYAIALGQGRNWTSAFEKALMPLLRDQEGRMSWYDADLSTFDAGSFTSSLTDFGHSVSQWAGSTGGGGGGSSGGGGGGGGGGGW